jgi:hypothetical protein
VFGFTLNLFLLHPELVSPEESFGQGLNVEGMEKPPLCGC